MKKNLVALFLFLFFLLSVFVSGNIDSQDGQLYLAVARYIYYTGEPTAPPYEFNYQGTGKNIHMGTYIGQDGKTYSPTGLGYSLALLPAVAITDLVYKVSGAPLKLEHFPLESDWLILLTASFTNAFFGAGLGVVLFLYFLDLGLNKKQSLILILVSLFATNLWVYTKHSFAHMMFIFFLVLSFYLLRQYLKKNRIYHLIFSAISFGITAITYNQTFVLSVIPLAAYYLLLSKPKLNRNFFKKVFRDLGIFILSCAPFLLTFIWYESFRVRVTTPGWTEDFTRQYSFLIHVPLSVFIEGLYGQLFSPGRSFFLYSPVLALPLFFHHKIKKMFKPELISFILISFIYIVFFASLFVIEDPKYGARGLWDGELSWGPRYLLVLIPFGMLLVAGIYKQLTKFQKLFIFLPIALFGIYINFLGIILPYQMKLHNLESEIVINGHKYTHFLYSNLLPRYTPIFAMTKESARLFKTLPEKINHGKYNVRFYDGIGFPFSVADQRWRAIENQGIIRFDDPKRDIQEISLEVVNQPLNDASRSALILKTNINGKELQSLEIPAREKLVGILPIEPGLLKKKDNQLIIEASFKEASASSKTQFAGLTNMAIKSSSVSNINLETLNYPFVSSLGLPLTGSSYNIYGKQINDPWKIWEIHTQIYERTPDFWWIKPLFYWDLPGRLFLILFLGNLIGVIYFGYLTFRFTRKI